jgi:AAA15 family ATPase/GTPase
MLIGFSFKNFMSFYEETNFSMKSVKNERFQGINTFKTTHGELLKSAFIFGANASGKTNVALVLETMKAIIFADTRYQSYLLKRLNTIASFNYLDGAKNAPCSFEVEFIIDDIIYRYGFEALNGEVNKEYLYKKTKRETPIFTRSSPDCSDIHFTGKDMANVEYIAKNTRRDTLFLYKANENNNELADKIYKWFDKILCFTTNDVSVLLEHTVNFMEKNIGGKDKVLELMKQADRNIIHFNYRIKDDTGSYISISNDENSKVNDEAEKCYSMELFTDRYLFDTKKEKALDMKTTSESLESSGTIKMFEIAGPIIQALDKGSIVFIDEIDSQLHPCLVRYIVALFNSIHNNPNNAQLICNTHDVLLLEEKIRKDQVYFTEKDKYGISSLYSLCEFNGLRKESKLLKMYLLGAFGAVPKLKEIYLHKKKKSEKSDA